MVDEYIAQLPVTAGNTLEKLRAVITQTAPEAEETISYRMPAFRLRGKILVYFAAFRNHIGFYPTASGVAAFSKDLASYKTSKGAIQFPLDKPIPYELIEKIVRYRMDEVLHRTKKSGEQSG